MDPKIIQAIIQFLQRAQLSGAEVPAFVTCMNELQKLANPEKPD